jgi:diguanylate cyclase (GGDEF)-like protein/PAS domain S-box-containing protein
MLMAPAPMRIAWQYAVLAGTCLGSGTAALCYSLHTPGWPQSFAGVAGLLIFGVMFAAAARRRAAPQLPVKSAHPGVCARVMRPQLLVGCDGSIRAANGPCLGTLGRSSEALVGTQISKLIGTGSADLLMQACLGLAGAAPGSRSGMQLDVALGRHWFEVGLSADTDRHSGEPCFLTEWRDITRRKLAELSLQCSGLGVLVTDVDCDIVLVNPAFTAITGYDEVDVLGRNPRMLSSGRQDQAFYQSMWASILGSGTWRGELWNRHKNGAVYAETLTIAAVTDAAGVIRNYIGVITDITERKRAHAEIVRLAHYDPLTGLPNRALLNDRANQALSLAQRAQVPVAVMFLDLDHFKVVNDSLGHRVGDLLLIEVAKRLQSLVREHDTVSRQGGDEFVIVLPGTGAAGAAHVAQKIRDFIAETMVIDQHELLITTSIGIAIFPGDGDSFDQLAREADTAMYRAKQEGRNGYRFYTAEMEERSRRMIELENALRAALPRDQLQLVFMPEMRLCDDAVVAVEALLRWHHPQLGWLDAKDFLAVAEDSGQMAAIGNWVLPQALSWLRQCHGAGLRSIVLTVNLSLEQLSQAQSAETLLALLRRFDLPPDCLDLDLGERIVTQAGPAAVAALTVLSEHGVRISIDDFGTGAVGLGLLRRFAPHKLKLDPALINRIEIDPDVRRWLAALMRFTDALGIRAVAEGVETAGQLQCLRELGCAGAQGYLYSRPLAAADMLRFALQHAAATDPSKR